MIATLEKKPVFLLRSDARSAILGALKNGSMSATELAALFKMNAAGEVFFKNTSLSTLLSKIEREGEVECIRKPHSKNRFRLKGCTIEHHDSTHRGAFSSRADAERAIMETLANGPLTLRDIRELLSLNPSDIIFESQQTSSLLKSMCMDGIVSYETRKGRERLFHASQKISILEPEEAIAVDAVKKPTITPSHSQDLEKIKSELLSFHTGTLVSLEDARARVKNRVDVAHKEYLLANSEQTDIESTIQKIKELIGVK